MMSLVFAARAHAQPLPKDVALHYEVEAALKECPSEAELRASIIRQLGADPFTSPPTSETYTVDVRIAPDGAGLEARLEWLQYGTPLGERRLSSDDDDCEELARAVAFAVAVQLQLRAASPVGPMPVAPKPGPAPPVRRAVVPSPTRSLLVGLGGLGRYGSQPGVAPGLRLFAALEGSVWAFAVDAHATLPTTEERPGGAGFSSREAGVSAAPCFTRGMVDACVVGALTLVSVQGRGVDNVRRPSTAGFGAGLRLQLTWPWTDRLAGVAHVDALAQLTQRDVLLNQETVWSTAPLVVAVGLDVAAIFR